MYMTFRSLNEKKHNTCNCLSAWHEMHLFLFCSLEKYINVNACVLARPIVYKYFHDEQMLFFPKLKLSMYRSRVLLTYLGQSGLWTGDTEAGG